MPPIWPAVGVEYGQHRGGEELRPANDATPAITGVLTACRGACGSSALAVSRYSGGRPNLVRRAALLGCSISVSLARVKRRDRPSGPVKGELVTIGVVFHRIFNPTLIQPGAQHELGALHAPLAARRLRTIIFVFDGSIGADGDFTNPFEMTIAVQNQRVLVVVWLPFTV